MLKVHFGHFFTKIHGFCGPEKTPLPFGSRCNIPFDKTEPTIMQSPLVTLWLLCTPFCLGSQSSENVCGLDDCTVLLQSNHAGVKPRQDQNIFFTREQDMALADSIQELTKRLPPGDTKDLFQSFSICGNCETWQRFGEHHDGGYLSCMDNMKNGTLLAAYSMGVEQHDKWSSDIYESFHIPVYQYDCTVSKPAQDCGDCHFFPACLTSGKSNGMFPGKTTWTLEEAIENSKMLDVPDRSLLMKMDVEASEWPVLANTSIETLKKFRQLIIEFHWLGSEDRHAEYVSVMHRLLHSGGFQVVHLHGNNYSGKYEKEGFKIPAVLELTLDALANQLTSCQDPKDLDLDEPNNPDGVDIGPWHTEK